MLLVILTMATTVAPSWAWNRMEEAAASLVHGSVWNHKGQKRLCPVLTCSCWSQTSLGYCKLPQSTEQRDHKHVPAVPACQQELAFSVSLTKGQSNFLSHLATVAHFVCNSWTLVRCLGGLCEEEEERVTGKEHPSHKGTSASEHGQGPWASVSQSAELGFHAALSCMSTNYNSLIFLNAK